MAIVVRKLVNQVIVSGDTFALKETLKSLGGRFNSTSKAWVLPSEDHVIDELEKIQRPEPQVPTIPNATGVQVGLTIGQLVTRIDQVITRGFANPVWVEGEIENFVLKENSTVYFNLVEKKQNRENTGLTIKCTIWASSLKYIFNKHGREKVLEILQNEMQVLLLVKVQFYKDRAQVSLGVEDIDLQFTKGALALAREKVIAELKKSGSYFKNKALPMPLIPFRIGLITAPDSRAYSDFVHQLEVGGFTGEIFFHGASMQGENVEDTVVAAVSALVQTDLDLIIITRGGGSTSDLRWFDQKNLALAIANCSVPVLCAIGHHDDTCVAEEVSHTREKTPTAAAEFVLKLFLNFRELIKQRFISLDQNLTQKLQREEYLLISKTRLLENAAFLFITRIENQILKFTSQMQQLVERNLFARKSQTQEKQQKLNQVIDLALQNFKIRLLEQEKNLILKSPLPWIEKGWTQLFTNKGMVKSIEDISVGDCVNARLKDGIISMKIAKTEKR